jgi:hypothetical protein
VNFFCGDKKKEGAGAICSMILFCGEFSPFCEKKFKNICWKNALLFFFLNSILFPKIATIDSNMKGCLRFSTFVFSIFSNLAKYTYELLPLKQHQEIDEKKREKKTHLEKYES